MNQFISLFFRKSGFKRLFFIVFSFLTQLDDDEFESKSDIMKLQAISNEQLYQLIEVDKLKPSSKRLIELAHQVKN